jgi:phosphoglycolate phosphatase-like HAD superfamily hydrolase
MSRFPTFKAIIFDFGGVLVRGSPVGYNPKEKNQVPADHIMPGVRRVIPRLSKEWRLAIVTGASKQRLSRDWPPELAKYFETIITREQIAVPKPAPDGLLLACERLGLKPEQAAYVGDADSDMACAKNAKMTAIGVVTGDFTADSLRHAGADRIIRSLDELLELD